MIFVGPHSDIPDDFKAAAIALDGRQQSDLNWSAQKSLGLDLTRQGRKILWDIDLGLFGRLPHPLSDERQFKSLGLALEHFYQFLWKEFSETTVGLCLYRGPLDLSSQFPWNGDQENNFLLWCNENHVEPKAPLSKKLYCRDIGAEYLNLLANFVPEPVQPFLFLDASGITQPFSCLCLLDPERTSRFSKAVKGSLIPTRDLVWKGPEITEPKSVNTGLYWPHSRNYRECCEQNYIQALERLQNRIPYRLIAEDHLITEWDGLDFLLVDPHSISPMGRRKILGFCAAGGTVVVMDDSGIGFPNEITLREFID